MFSPDQWAASTGVAFYNGVATQSLRFDDGSTAYLTRTPSSAGNRKTWTMSFWIKFSSIKAQTLFATRTDTTPYGEIRFESDGGFFFYGWTGSAYQYRFDTTQLFRDVSAWYHFVFAMDTTQSTESNRTKIYVNGSQITAFDNEIYPTQNVDTNLNTTVEHDIGYDVNASVQAFDGYMAEYNFIDGQQLDPTSFGEFKNGVWIAKEYTGSYGTNGFRLQFNQTGTGTASSSTIGADTSGNDNHFSSSGIVASDCDMPDSPENNFCTLNPLNTGDAVLSEGNLKTPNLTTDTNNLVASTFQVGDGKWYWEFLYDNVDADYAHIGITQTNGYDVQSFDNYLGYRADQWSIFAGNGNKRNNQSFDSYGSGFSDNDIGMIALDMDNNKIWWGKNGTWFNSGDPASGTNAGFTNLSGEVTPALSSRDIVYFNFGQDSSFVGNKTAQGNTDANGIGDFYYSPPSGYLALCTSNLPEPTISPNADTQADDYFNTVLYSGNGTTQSITGVGFQADWVWLKNRGAGWSHSVNDSVRGVGKNLYADATDAEVTNNAYGYLSSFDSDGFTVTNGASGAEIVNATSNTYVSWNWKAGGTAVSNTDGDITSSVSANTDAGFSIVSYTGNATSGATIGHGLSPLVPKFVIIKNRDTAGNWTVRTTAVDGSSDLLQLNLTDAKADSSRSAPTSTVFSVGSGDVENKSGDDLIAYCFAEIDGYSKFGSYTGNGSSDGTFVYTGFRPAFVLFKRTDSAESWRMYDEQREGYNVRNNGLFPNLSNAENSTDDRIDILSNGFKLRSTDSAENASGGTYIYMSFAENPFKYSLGR